MSKNITCQSEGGSLNATPSRVPKPLTATEHYWATRALKAEALLAAQDNYKKEFKTLEHAQDMKREVLLFVGCLKSNTGANEKDYSVK